MNNNFEMYRKSVEYLASTDSNYVFGNNDIAHAEVVLSTFFRYSSHIRIFDIDLSGDISNQNDEFINRVTEFIQKKKILKILVRNSSNSNSDIYKTLSALSKRYSETVSVRTSVDFDKLDREILSMFNYNMYFTIGDSKGFRFERLDDDYKERKAFCSFNNPKFLKKLPEVFDNFFENHCKPFF